MSDPLDDDSQEGSSQKSRDEVLRKKSFSRARDWIFHHSWSQTTIPNKITIKRKFKKKNMILRWER